MAIKELFSIEKQVSKKVKNIPTLVLEPYKDSLTPAKLTAELNILKKQNVLSFVVTNAKTGVKTAYLKQKRDANYTVKTLKK